MPMYDLICGACGKVVEDVLCEKPLKAGEKASPWEWVVDADGDRLMWPIKCSCGAKQWTRVKDMPLTARHDRAWTASCQFSKKG
jgi:hypothetical protein